MAVHDRAGTPAQPQDLLDVARLVTAYYTDHPDPDDPDQRVAFGTSGHRGSSFGTAFNDDHIAATSQALADHRRAAGIDGPLLLAKDTHALSEPAWATALEVFAANGVTVLVDSRDGYTPTPALSHAVLTYNRGRRSGLADGVVITPSHNPPRDGGFKYNPPDGGPAGSDVTGAVQDARQRAPARRAPAGAARAAVPGPGRRHHRDLRLPRRLRRRPALGARPRRGARRRASGSAPTRSAGRASPTGARSPSGTGST